MATQSGPTIRVDISCLNCQHCHSERYRVQGDSGSDVRCTHPAALKDRYIGDTTWKTPEWCPLLPEAWGDFICKLNSPDGEEDSSDI